MKRIPKYTNKQRKIAVEYYLFHGKNASRTCKKLGYPSRPLLIAWILEDVPGEKRNCRKSSSVIKYTQKEKEQAVIQMCSNPETVQSVADSLGVSRAALYYWKQRILRKGDEYSMTKKKLQSTKDTKNISVLTKERDHLVAQVNDLQKQILWLQLEKDVLEKVAEIIKKAKVSLFKHRQIRKSYGD